jgi:hypothetical protein
MTSPHADEQRVLITPEELNLPGSQVSLATAAHALLAQQKRTWPTLQTGYASLSSIQTHGFEFDGSTIRIQFNPGRMTSSAAKVDDKSIRERKCFLCLAHLPNEQRGIPFGDSYVVLCNPFPIFPEHFTIPHREHFPQRIDGAFGVLLDLTKAMGERYTVFYNGPRCGASAPDHLHFQAGLKGFMPLDQEYATAVERHGTILRETHDSRTVAIDGGLRRFVAIESTSRAAMEREFDRLLLQLKIVLHEADEPMMNILSLYEDGYRVLVFPRAKHRPSFFFAEGDARILISPAAVDLGGVCITPVEGDFHKLTRMNIEEMFGEISVGQSTFAELCKALK